jgi:hypothetical protein
VLIFVSTSREDGTLYRMWWPVGRWWLLWLFVVTSRAAVGADATSGGVPAPPQPSLIPNASLAPSSPVSRETAAETSHRLIGQARSGDIEAMAHLISLGYFDAIAEVDPRAPVFSSWLSRREPVGAFTSQQIYGVHLATWAAHNSDRLGALFAATMVRARSFIISKPTQQPIILLQAAWHLHSFEPRDDNAARALFIQGLLMCPFQDGDAGDRLGAAMTAASVAASCSWKEADDLIGEFQALAARQADPFYQGRARWIAALAVQTQVPAGHRTGDAIHGLAEAAELLALAKDPLGRAECLYDQATLLKPSSTATSTATASWTPAVQAFAESARSFAAAGSHYRQALALLGQADGVRPDINPQGSWDEASRLLVAAADGFALAGDDRRTATTLDTAARLAAHLDPLRATVEARRLQRDAVSRYRALNMDQEADALLAWFMPSGDGN